jgi:transcriptional regulator with XRE-family HTH domain
VAARRAKMSPEEREAERARLQALAARAVLAGEAGGGDRAEARARLPSPELRNRPQELRKKHAKEVLNWRQGIAATHSHEEIVAIPDLTLFTLTPTRCWVARTQLGWSVPSLAQRAGLGAQTIRDFETAKHFVSNRTRSLVLTVLKAGYALKAKADRKAKRLRDQVRDARREDEAFYHALTRSARTERLRQQLSLSEMAKRTGLHRATIRDFESGKRASSAETTIVILVALGLVEGQGRRRDKPRVDPEVLEQMRANADDYRFTPEHRAGISVGVKGQKKSALASAKQVASRVATKESKKRSEEEQQRTKQAVFWAGEERQRAGTAAFWASLSEEEQRARIRHMQSARRRERNSAREEG